MLTHLTNGWQVDQAILSEEDKIVLIRFGHDWDPTCMKMDETLFAIAEKVKNFCVIYLVDITQVLQSTNCPIGTSCPDPKPVVTRGRSLNLVLHHPDATKTPLMLSSSGFFFLSFLPTSLCRCRTSTRCTSCTTRAR